MRLLKQVKQVRQTQQVQRGIATLSIALVLLFAVTLMTFTLARTTLMEQRMTRNELHAAEARQGAAAALDQGLDWLAHHPTTTLAWRPDPQQRQISTRFDAAEVAQAASGEAYDLSFQFHRHQDAPDYIETIATAQATSGLRVQLRQYARPQLPLRAQPPPLVVDGCIGRGAGGATLYPAADEAPVLSTTHADDSAGRCIPGTGLELNGGIVQDQAPGGGALWWQWFQISKQQFALRAAEERVAVAAGELRADQRSYYWIDDAQDGRWYRPLEHDGAIGSPDHPVIIVLSAAAECAPLASGLLIYGVLFYETGATGACDAGDWGGVQLYGGLLVAGDLYQLGGGARLYHYRHSGAGDLLARLKPIQAPAVPGTWRDF